MVLPAMALMIGLGVWQVQRLHWKEGLIEAVNTRLHADPVPLAAALALPPDQREYRVVRITGRFLHEKEAYLFTSGPGGARGVQVITPLERADGKTVLIDRGFVPEEKKATASRETGQVAGEVTVTGVLRESQPPGLFTPAPDLKNRLWFSKDAASLAAASGVALAAPVIIEADAAPNPGGWPQGGQTRVDFPNNHLQYAGTWFGLALTLLAVYLVYHYRQGRLRFGR
jgi:surfeit locus 1 family protein